MKEELFIGAWVLYRGIPTKIDGIAEGGFSVHLSGDRWVSLSDVSPIALTPEILEKNGFKRERTNDNVLVYFKGGEVVYYEFGENYGITVDNSLAQIKELKVRHVHQLQHALRLCGIEKEVIV